MNIKKYKIDSPNEAISKEVKCIWDYIAKPLDSMGRFEEITAQIGGIIGTTHIDISKKAVIIMCADNGIVEEGISQSTQEVTAIVAESMAKGESSVCKMAKHIGVDTKVVDIGINKELTIEGILNKKIAYGTHNFLKSPAMSEEEAVKAIEVGIEMVRSCSQEGYQILAMGEMGIGNTTTSSAVAAALLGCPVGDITGKGAGLSEEGLVRKCEVIQTAIDHYELLGASPLRILSTVGGLDIAGLVGVCIGGAIYKIPIVLDGVISAIAALTAERMASGVRKYLIPSHISKEPAVKYIMEELSLFPILDAQMALGEGTGAIMLLSLLDMALAIYQKQTQFDDIGIQQYERMSGIE